MKRMISFFIFTVLVLVLGAGCAPAAIPAPTITSIPPTATPPPASPTPAPEDELAKFHWFGTAAILYNGSKAIYFDPITLNGDLPKADIILVTHAHSDHWSVADLQKIIGPNTTLIIGTNVSQSYEAAKTDLGITATILNEGDKTEVDGVGIEAVPAYDTTFHQKSSGGVGFIVNVDGLKLYHAGGTQAIPEMANYTCDYAFIPLTSKAAGEAFADILPAKTIIFEHTSYYAAQAVAILLNESYAGAKNFVALELEPKNP